MQSFQPPPSCRLTPLSLSHLCAQYLHAQFQFKLNERRSELIGATTAPQVPLMLPICVHEPRLVIYSRHPSIIPETIQAVKIEWVATCYVDKLPKKQEKPGTAAADAKEAIMRRELSWHGTFLESCLILGNEMMVATQKLHSMLEKRPKGTSWHVDPGYFPSGLEGLQGLVDFSPAWFQQGHELGAICHSHWSPVTSHMQSNIRACAAVRSFGQSVKFTPMLGCPEVVPSRDFIKPHLSSFLLHFPFLSPPFLPALVLTTSLSSAASPLPLVMLVPYGRRFRLGAPMSCACAEPPPLHTLCHQRPVQTVSNDSAPLSMPSRKSFVEERDFTRYGYGTGKSSVLQVEKDWRRNFQGTEDAPHSGHVWTCLVCVRIRGQRVAKDEGGEEEQPEKNGEEIARIVLRVPAFGPDFRDNHAERGGKKGDQALLFHSM
ncbi:hypothetical protein EDB86DRAFT_2834213 [Lactarius hatsudake]|nr:hypothetical protein EDB86DRAFT_2834213 [Lactarius hatsudake]